ncbi:MAG: hypothetical protein WC314_18235 [Vulcanimicrobiota bacterium]
MNILLCWGYHRKGWIACLEELNDEFDFTYLYYRQSWEEEGACTDCPRVYWNDFQSGFEVLDRLRPEKVVFMSIDSGYAVALNVACRARGVPTLILQHGLAQSLEEYLAGTQTRDTPPAVSPPPGARLSKTDTLLFLIRSVPWWQYWKLPRLLLYFLVQSKRGSWYAQFRLGSSDTRPNHYICFSYQNAQVYRELDPGSEARTSYIGIPEFASFFERTPLESQGEYYLLIDQPWAENRYGQTGITREQMISMYNILAEYAANKNRRLRVKLHPESYRSDWLPQHENIDWIRDADVFKLITGADGVFGSNSTLMLPALYFRPCFLIDGTGSRFVADVLGRGIARGCSLSQLNSIKISFVERKPDSPKFIEFVCSYLSLNGERKSLREQLAA